MHITGDMVLKKENVSAQRINLLQSIGSLCGSRIVFYDRNFAQQLLECDTEPVLMFLSNREGDGRWLVGLMPLATGDDRREFLVLFTPEGEREPEVPASLISQSFNLTPAESRLLKTMIGGDRGNSASTLAISKETARSYLKRIFEKTGTHSQMGLLHLSWQVTFLHSIISVVARISRNDDREAECLSGNAAELGARPSFGFPMPGSDRSGKPQRDGIEY